MLIIFDFIKVIEEQEGSSFLKLKEKDVWIEHRYILNKINYKTVNKIITYHFWQIRNLDIKPQRPSIIQLSWILNVNRKPLIELMNEKTSNYFPKKAMKHQEECFKWAIDKKCVALFNDMGTGKSKLYIDIANYHYFCGNIKNVVFFAPPTTLPNFKYELELWNKTDLKWDLLSIHQLSIDFYHKEKMDKLLSIINQETMIIIDESHKIKNIDSLMGKTAKVLGSKTNYKIIGTGTPAPNSGMDLLGQFRFLTPQEYNQSHNSLKLECFNILDNKTKTNLNLINKTHTYTWHIAKKDCLDLPNKIYSNRWSKNEEFNLFLEREKKNVSESFIEHSSLMGFLQNLRKVATGRNLDNEIIVKNPKIELLKELLESINHQKIIIWHNLYIELEDILQVIKGDYKLLNGSQNEQEKADAIQSFKYEDTKYLIATQSTGGVGLNFTEATCNIYFSNSFNLIDRLQSESRSHRIGQKEELYIYDLINTKSIDEKINASLARKEDFMIEIQELYKSKNKKDFIKNVF